MLHERHSAFHLRFAFGLDFGVEVLFIESHAVEGVADDFEVGILPGRERSSVEDRELFGQFWIKRDGFSFLLPLLLRRFCTRYRAARSPYVLSRRRQRRIGEGNVGPEGVLDRARGRILEDFGPDVVGPVGSDWGD